MDTPFLPVNVMYPVKSTPNATSPIINEVYQTQKNENVLTDANNTTFMHCFKKSAQALHSLSLPFFCSRTRTHKHVNLSIVQL